MNLSWTSISAGAMTAAVSLGSSMQAIGAGATAAAAQALPTVAAGSMQAVTSGASAAAAALPGTLPAALPQAVSVGAAGTAELARDIAVVEKPARAMAQAAPRSSLLLRTAGTLSKVLPVVAIGASALAGAHIVQKDGIQALVTTKEGRGAVLGAAGGALLLVPHPATQLAAAGVLGAVAVNHFGGLDRLDGVRLDAAGPGAAAAAPPVTG